MQAQPTTIEVHPVPVPVHEKHTGLHAFLAFSVMANLLLAGSLVSTFLNDLYFREWVLGNVYPMIAVTVASIGVLGLFVNVGVWLNGLRKHFIRIGERRVATRLGVELQ